jgi:dihydrofolate reductase
MARLIYSAMTSLDGYVADRGGVFRWAAPDEEVHAFVNDLERPIGTYLYGRRMYEVMQYWETVDVSGDEDAVARDWATLWRAAEKVVYSRSLASVSTARTRLERSFDAEEVHSLKQGADHDITVGGPDLAGQALRAGLVDELQVFLTPIVIGGGTHWLPSGVRVPLTLVEQRRFERGVAFLRYRVDA